MWKLHCILFIIGIFVFQPWMSTAKCIQKKDFGGVISDSYDVYGREYQKCWNVYLPPNHFIRLNIQSVTNSLKLEMYNYSYVQISANESSDIYKFYNNDSNRHPVTALREVEIVFFAQERPLSNYFYRVSFSLQYEIQEIECIKRNNFRCSNHSCIPKDQVCDGVINCQNGADEIGCGTRIIAIEGVTKARSNAIAWLKSKPAPTWEWQENVPRAATALFLAAAANFNGKNVEEERMLEQTELKISIALLKNSTPNELLSTFINALLVTCENPRRFYGYNLIERLKNQVESTLNFTHPAAYLALCNANESWPIKANEDLSRILDSDSEYYFVRDIQAFAIMAISCMSNRTQSFLSTNVELASFYQKSIRRFKENQLSDGSFGNVYTTSLIMQALLSSGQELAPDLKLNAAIMYLIKELNSSSVDFLSTYLTLPVLNAKSLADIATVNCTANPRKQGDDDLVAEVKENIGPKMRIQYSLFVGKEKYVIHRISLQVPENFTAYEVMKLAEVEDHKYKFEWKRVDGKMNVYKIANIKNDAEAGKFWLLHLGSIKTGDEVENYTSSPDELVLHDGDSFIFWYKTAPI